MPYSQASPSLNQDSPGQLIAAQNRFLREEGRPIYDGIAVTPTRERKAMTFGMIPEPVFALGGEAIALYAFLARHANRDGECWPAMKTICEVLGWSPKLIRPAMAKLIEAGHVVKVERKLHGMDQANLYVLPFLKKPANVQVVPTEPAVVPTEPLGGSQGTPGWFPQNHELDKRELDTKEPEGGTRKRASALPKDFDVTDAMRSWAVQLGLSNKEIVDATEAFIDHHIARRSTFIDWVAAWRSWMRKEIKWNPKSAKKKSYQRYPTPEYDTNGRIVNQIVTD